MKCDFSQFHPLTHRVFSRECWGWYGGPIQHIKLWWQYQGPGYHEEDWEPVEDPWEEKRNDQSKE